MSEKDHDNQFLIRNEGWYRGLGSLFPGVSLKIMGDIARVCSENRLYMGKRVVGFEIVGSKRLRKVLTHATSVLTQKVGNEITASTYQRYLDLACDIRILKSNVTSYAVHSYGLSLVALYGIRGWPSHNQSDDVAWRCYFIDRLLFEDGDYFKEVLRILASRETDQNSTDLGIRMHDAVFDALRERLRQHPPFAIKRYIETKIKEYDDAKRNPHRTLRRTELEYTVRRDWLVQLGLAKLDDAGATLTQAGKILADEVVQRELDIEFFNNAIFSLLGRVFGMGRTNITDMASLMEPIYTNLAGDKGGVVETLVLINTAILSQLPTLIGERAELLDSLREAYAKNQTRLVLQSGYRTKDYYVNSRGQITPHSTAS